MADRMGLLLIVEGLSDYKNATVSVTRLNDGVAASMTDVEKASGGAQVGVKNLTASFVKGSIAADLIMRTFRAAVDAAKKVTIGSTMLTARVDVLGTVLERVGGNVGYAKTQLDALEESVKANGITTRAARQSLIMMAQANVDLAYATDLSRVAQDAAVIAGINSSDAFERLIYAMSRGRTYIMRTLGIMTDFVKAEEKLAAQLGIERKELTENQLMQARYQETLRAATAIQGSYTEAMGKAGKQMTSIPRYLEEIQLAFGETFQPAFTTLIFEIKDRLADLLDLLKDPATKQALDDLGASLDKILKLLFQVVDTSARELPKTVQAFREIAVVISNIVWPLETAQQAVDDLAEHWWQFVTMGLAGGAMLIEWQKQWWEAIQKTAGLLVSLGAVTAAVWTGEADAIEAAVKQFGASWEEALEFGTTFADDMAAAYEDAIISVGRFVGVVEDISPDALRDFNVELDRTRRAAEAARQGIDEVGEATIGLTDDMRKASEALVELRLRLQRELADQLIQQERDALKRAIELARDREDIARRNAQAISDAYRRAAEARADLEEDTAEKWADFERGAAKKREEIDRDYARTKLDIERDTRRRLEDIQRDFEFALLDAARTRDAFALVSAQRRAAREREETLKGRDRQLEDAKTSYDQQRDDLARSLAEQREDLRRSLSQRQQDIERQLQKALQAAEEQRREDLASLERRNQREREMAALQAQWEEEDRRRRLARQLEDIEHQYGVLLSVTAESLLQQVKEWAEAYGPEGAASRIVRSFADLAVREAERVRQATVDMVNEWLRAMRLMSQVSPVGIPLPPEFQFQSPKLGLQVGLENLQKYLRDQPLTIMPQGTMPATQTSMFSRAETFARTESVHDVNMNLPPGQLDVVVQQQMLAVLRGLTV